MTQDRSWRKSSYSNGTPEGECVEVSLAHDALVRDSKNVAGEVLAFSTSAWRAFVASV
ncbi:DUF397 domain-containing protein [Lentzea flava]|uniref:DUF397 domain-containing protein n=1 Tax=Lentzea flava TaxID=103732 RepID=A0ABQ2UHB2_9PSEU|nr:DUF397 domain-containing protein [Lentzea flava]MCP2199185.1 protein of unknown function (DUF397) [Lentzea flava]GGU33908.1 hypothetical protein GCM10010178_27620 [Lentzea flava]